MTISACPDQLRAQAHGSSRPTPARGAGGLADDVPGGEDGAAAEDGKDGERHEAFTSPPAAAESWEGVLSSHVMTPAVQSASLTSV